MMKFSKLLAQSLVWRGVYFVTLFAVNLMLSRYFGAAKAGAIFYISNTFAFVQLLAGLSFESGITFFAASKQISYNQLLWFCLMWTAVVVIIQVVSFQFFSFRNDLITNQKLAQYAFCFITGLLLITYGSNLFYANGNFFFPNSILSFFNLCFIVVIIYSGYRKHLASNDVIDAYFFVYLCQGITIMLAFLFQNKSWRQFSLPPLSQTKNFTRYSLTVLLFNVLLFLVYRIDYYFVKYSPVSSDIDLGNYIQASKLGQMLLIIPQIIGSAVYPQVSSGNDIETVSKMILILIKLLAILFLFIFIFLLCTGKWLFPFLLGVTFQKVHEPLLLLLPGIYGLAIISFISNFFSGQGHVSVSVKAAIVAFLIVVGGDALYVYKYGIIAAAIVSSVGYFIMFCLYILPFKKEAHLHYSDFFQLKKSDLLLLKKFFTKEDNKDE